MHPIRRHRVSRIVSRSVAVAALFAVSLISAAPLSAREKECGKPKPLFSALYVFGDSLSDTGNMYALSGGAIPPASLYWNGHSSNGQLWPEYLARAIGLDYDQSTNFACAGANTGTFNAWESTLGVDLPGILDEVAAFHATLGAGRADPDALYVVFGGANDFFRVTPANANQVIGEAVQNIATIVCLLHAYGAEHIVVVGLPDIGLTPRALSGGAEAAGMATYLSGVFNLNVGLALDALAANGIETVRVDTFTLLQDMVARPHHYGFVNVTEPSTPDYDMGRSSLFWDVIHPTTRAQGWIALEMLEALDDADLIHGGHGFGRWDRPPFARGLAFGRR